MKMSEPLEINIEIPSRIVIREGGGGDFDLDPSTFKLIKTIQKLEKLEKQKHPIRWFFRYWYIKISQYL